MVCLLRKVIIELHPGAYEVPSHRSRFTLSDMCFFLLSRTEIQPESGWLPRSICTSIAPMSMSGHSCYQCSLQDSQEDKTVGDFSFQVASTVPSSTMKAGHQGRGFLVSTNLISPCPLTKVCHDFNNRVLPLSTGGQLGNDNNCVV